MDDLDVTEKVPRALETDAPSPAPLIGISMPGSAEIVPLSTRRAANGTRTRLAALPPPLPHRANRASTAPPTGYPIVRDKPATIPPPIPVKSLAIATPPPLPRVAQTIAIVPPPVNVPEVPTGPIPGFDVEVDTENEDFDAGEAGGEPGGRASMTFEAAAPMPSFHIETDEFDDHDVGNIHRNDDDDLEPAPPRRNLAAIIGIGVGLGVVGLVLALGLGGGSSPAAVAKAAPVAHKYAAPVLATPTVVAPPPVAAPVALPAPAPAPAPVAEVAPAIAPPPAELARPATDVAVPITSNPAGAIVTLIDDGDATVVGRTPVTAVLDPARSYEVVVAMHGHPTKIQRVNPHDAHAINVELQPIAAPAAQPAPAKHLAAEPAPAPVKVAKPVKTATAPAPTPVAVTTASGDTGLLMVSSKPPCNIAIDGKVTRLMTPQRAIALSPGAHSITLTNAQQKIAKTIAVRITAKQSTKLIQDFSK